MWQPASRWSWLKLAVGLALTALALFSISRLQLGWRSEWSADIFLIVIILSATLAGFPAALPPAVAGLLALSGFFGSAAPSPQANDDPSLRVVLFLLVTGYLLFAAYRSHTARRQADLSLADRTRAIDALSQEVELRRGAEQRADLQREQLETTLAGILDAVITTDAHGSVLYANPAAASILGCPAEECLGQNLQDLLVVEDEHSGERLQPLAFRVLASGNVVTDDLSRVVRHPDGSRIPVEVTAAPIGPKGSANSAVVTILRDVREKRAVQRALLESEERFRIATEAGNLGVWVWNLQTDSAVWNATLARLVGVSETEYRGPVQPFFDAVHPDDLPSLQRSVQTAIRRGEVFYHEFRLVRPGGSTRWLIGSGKPLHDSTTGELTLFAGVNVDITDRKFAEERIFKLNHDLEELALQLSRVNQHLQQRTEELERVNDAKTRFLSSMSHELRTPLNSICGFTELLLEQQSGSLGERQQRYLRNIDTSAQHLIRVVSDVLDLSRIAAGRLSMNPQSVVLKKLADEVVTSFAPMSAEQGVTLAYAVDDSIHLRADPERLRQVLTNLIGNAIKFTPAGGNVTVAARSAGDEICIDVQDTGVGIPADKLDAIFEEFEQVHHQDFRPKQRGSGLGLAITQRLVELHGGRVEVRSEVGKGSEFRVILPVAGAMAAPAS